MRSLAFVLFLLAGVAYAPTTHALHWQLAHRVCPFDFGKFPIEIEDIPVPVGCEIVDCCPGCPGPGPIDWRIRFEGPDIRSLSVRFEGADEGALRRLGLRDAVLGGDGVIELRGREATITGLPFATRGKVWFGSLMPEFEAKSMDSSDADEADHGAGGSIVVEQLLRGRIVNSFRLDWVVGPCFWPRPRDRIRLVNNLGGDSAVIVSDHRAAAGCVDDAVFRTAGTVGIGNALRRDGCNAEVAVYSDDNAMALQSPNNIWTNLAGDLDTISLQPTIAVPVTVWLARANALATATNDLANANLLYNQNNIGVRFVPTFQNVSTNANAVATIAPNGTATTGSDACNAANGVLNSTFFTPNTLNVYYTPGGYTGVNCGANRNLNFVGTIANIATTPHEIGHAYGLRPSGSGGHTNGLAGFGNDNIMWGGGPATRNHFSVGQAFRLNVDTGSMLNGNGNRTGLTRGCAPNATSPTCPALALDALPH